MQERKKDGEVKAEVTHRIRNRDSSGRYVNKVSLPERMDQLRRFGHMGRMDTGR